MKSKFRFLLPLLAATMSLSGCFIEIVKDDPTTEDDYNAPIVVGDYYKDYDLTKTGGRLILELQKQCFDKHKNYVSYGQVNSYYSKTTNRNSVEAISDGSSLNQYFYTGKEATGYGTREHVWPCANSGALWVHDDNAESVHNVDKSYYTGGGSDLYHVRTCNTNVNTARGNGKYVDFDHTEFTSIKSDVATYGENKGKYQLTLYGASKNSSGVYQYADKVEVDDHMKGDVARIVLYVWLHYTDRGITPSGSVKGSDNKHTYNFTDMVGSLALTSVMGYGTEERCKEVLKEWNKLDAPSEVEKLRNDTVQRVQGNRNPFVDHPELVDQMFN